MKATFILLVLLAASTSSSFSQNRSRFYHIIKRSMIESGYLSLVYKDTSGSIGNVSLCSERRRAIITLERGVPVLDFWQIVDNDYVDSASCLSKETQLGRFEIDLSRPTVGHPTRFVVVPFRAWTWGVGTTPFRYRPKADSSFATISTSLGVSINFGRTFGWSTISPRTINNFSITLGPFVGISSVDLKRSTVKKPHEWQQDRTNVAVSYGLNASFARNNFGVVLSIGLDNNFGEDSNEWSYQNRPWFGIGVNTGLGIF